MTLLAFLFAAHADPSLDPDDGVPFRSVGDLDGDGQPELIGNVDGEHLEILWGGSDLATTLADPDASNPSGVQSMAGVRVISKDLDGDGVPDLLIGAPGFNAERHDVGRVYLVPGGRLDASVERRRLDSIAVGWIEGEAFSDRVGEHIRVLDGGSLIEVRIEEGQRAGTYVFDSKLKGPVPLASGRKS
ncbi:MAG: hypothetical protein GY913_06850 [Proteobacteria bacterium]|nr:hypothetical protein [Pseudomonadota bacterium]MCP4916625.1 hypothetical protein [Pseudomonadota bacterium]